MDERALQLRCSFRLPGQDWIRVLRAEGGRLVVEDVWTERMDLIWRIAPGWSWDGESTSRRRAKRSVLDSQRSGLVG